MYVKFTYPGQRSKTPPLSHYFLLVKVNPSMRHLELVPAFFTPVLVYHLHKKRNVSITDTLRLSQRFNTLRDS